MKAQSLLRVDSEYSPSEIESSLRLILLVLSLAAEEVILIHCTKLEKGMKRKAIEDSNASCRKRKIKTQSKKSPQTEVVVLPLFSKMKFEFDSSGSTFFYFIASLLALYLVPATLHRLNSARSKHALFHRPSSILRLLADANLAESKASSKENGNAAVPVAVAKSSECQCEPCRKKRADIARRHESKKGRLRQYDLRTFASRHLRIVVSDLGLLLFQRGHDYLDCALDLICLLSLQGQPNRRL